MARYAAERCIHLQQQVAHTLEQCSHTFFIYFLNKDLFPCWGNRKLFLLNSIFRAVSISNFTLHLQRGYWSSTNLQINILSEFIFSMLSAMLKGHSSSGWWMGANVAQGLRVDWKRNVPYNTQTYTHKHPLQMGPPLWAVGSIVRVCGVCVCMCMHACVCVLVGLAQCGLLTITI